MKMGGKIFLCVLLTIAAAHSEESNASDGWSWVSDSADIGSQDSQNKTSDSIVDDILSSSRHGRHLDSSYTEVYEDPQVQQALQAGNDTSARHYIKERLCNLGLMSVSCFLLNILTMSQLSTIYSTVRR